MMFTISGSRVRQGVTGTAEYSIAYVGISRSYYLAIYPIAHRFLGVQGRFRLLGPLHLGATEALIFQVLTWGGRLQQISGMAQGR